MNLIDKDALVADIENLENTYTKCPTRNSYEEGLKDGRLIGYKDALHKINTLEVKNLPIWEKVSPDTGQTTLYKDEDKSYLERFGYRIDLKDLDKLPKKNLKAQKEE